jgi:nucleoside-diphosphate-sugar epimerase
MIVSILGCGWYGRGLAQSLINKGITVKGSTTSAEKLTTLEAADIKAYLININSPENSVIDPDFFFCDVLVIANNVKMTNEGVYLVKINSTIALIKQYQISKVIFVSSTSVYGDDNREVNEATPAIPETTSGKLLLQGEGVFMANTTFTTTIVRFGGLVGPGRNPGRFFTGKIDVPNGLAPVNLIHLDDCIGITEALLSTDQSGLVINAVSPDHPAKSEFYKAAAKNAGLIIPEFIPEKKQWKIVNSVHVNDLLNYRFKIDNWLDSFDGTNKNW